MFRLRDVHISDGLLLAYGERQLVAAEWERVVAHVEACPRCQERLSRLMSETVQVAHLMGTLDPGPLPQIESRRALSGLRQSLRQTSHERRLTNPMFERLLSNRTARRVLAGVAVVAVLAGALSFAPVRAAASNFLSMFRVEKFEVIQVDPGRLEEIAESIPEDAYFGEQEVIQEGVNYEVASVGEAADAAGFAPLVPQGYGDPAKIVVAGGEVLRFTPDVEGLREVFSAVGLDPELLPESIDGQPFDATVPVGVMLAYGDAETGEGFAVFQSPSPTFDVPDGVDMQALGKAMLILLGVPADEAEQLSKSIDWATTLVLPIPTDMATVTEVQVNGVSGWLIESLGSGDPDMPDAPGASLLWQKDGYVYLVTTSTPALYDLLAIAESLQ